MSTVKTKSIAILGTRGIPASYGGFETFAEELALRLVKRGVSVTVYCEADAAKEETSYHGVRLVHVVTVACGPLATIVFDLISLWKARKGHDVVYMLGYGAAPFCVIPRLSGSTVWLNVDGVEWARAKWGNFAKIYFKTMEWFSTWIPNRVIADAEAIRTHLKHRHKRLPSCSVIPYGAPIIEEPPTIDLLKEWNLVSKEYYLVVSRIEPENHVLDIVEGYKKSRSSIPLVIVGNHNSGTAYAAKFLPLANEQVRLIGAVYDKAKLEALRWHSLAYFHGHSVGGTNPSLLEALGCGNLIIAHENPYNREVVSDIGFYFRCSDDIPDLVAEVEALDQQQRQQLSDMARSKISEDYQWEKIVDNYLNLLNDI